MGKQVVECMHCGARVEPAFLITSNEVRNMLGRDAVPLDVIYQSYLNQLCVPRDEQLYQLVFQNEDELPKSLRVQIRQKNGEFYYTTTEARLPNVRVTSRACPICHSNLTKQLRYPKVVRSVLVGPPGVAKTVTLGSLYNVGESSRYIRPGFSAGSFEGGYYASIAADLKNGLVPLPTAYMEGKAERQPLFSVEVIGRNGKRQLLVLEDQPGENLLHEQFHLPADCTVVYLIDGADPDSTPVSDYVKLAAETSFVKRFVIAVTKSDRLPAEAVQQAMLAEYDTVSAQFTFPELQLMREYAMQDLLRAVCPAAARLESELWLLGRNSQIRTVFTSALGTNTEAGRLLGPYRPYGMTDLALTLIHDD